MGADSFGRNIVDKYADWAQEDIKQDLQNNSHNFSTLADNTEKNLNVSVMMRSHNAFGGKQFYVYGRRKADRRGCQGCYNYMNVEFVPDESSLDWSKFCVVGIENNIPGTQSIFDFEWDYARHTLFCLGRESIGLSKEILDHCESIVEIPMFGSIPSFNLASAASIVMFDYLSKMRRS